MLGAKGATGGAGRLRMIRRLPRRATTDPVVTLWGSQVSLSLFLGVPGSGKGSGMCIPGLRGNAAAGTDPARLAVLRNATSPGNVTCPRWGQQHSLHPLSLGVGQEQPGWRGTLWSSAFPGGAPPSPGWGGEQDRGSPGRSRDPPLPPRPKTEVKHRTRLKAVHEGARFG